MRSGGVAVYPVFHVADGMGKAALAYLTRHLATDAGSAGTGHRES